MTNPMLPVDKYTEEDLEAVGWTREQITAWSKGNWTPQQILALEKQENEHIDNCDECQERLEIDPRTIPEDEPYYCPIGESFAEQTNQAIIEYSWQPDFDPDWENK